MTSSPGSPTTRPRQISFRSTRRSGPPRSCSRRGSFRTRHHRPDRTRGKTRMISDRKLAKTENLLDLPIVEVGRREDDAAQIEGDATINGWVRPRPAAHEGEVPGARDRA